MFLAQVLSADGSRQQAVDEAVIKRIIGGLPVCAASTSAYSQARKRLPTEAISSHMAMNSRLLSRFSR